MAEGDEKYIKESASDRMVSVYHRMYDALPVVLVLLMIYLPISLFTDIYHWSVDVLELSIVAYFGVKILVGFIIYESKITYLKKNWLDILLILPFLAAFRAVGVVAQLLRGAYIIEALGLSGLLGEASVAARFARVSRLSYVGEIKYVQKILHFVKDVPLVLKSHVPNAVKAKIALVLAYIHDK